MDHYHGVLLPRFPGLLVSNTAPQVNDLLAVDKGATGSAQLPSPNKVLNERLTHGLEATADAPLNTEAM